MTVQKLSGYPRYPWYLGLWPIKPNKVVVRSFKVSNTDVKGRNNAINRNSTLLVLMNYDNNNEGPMMAQHKCSTIWE